MLMTLASHILLGCFAQRFFHFLITDHDTLLMLAVQYPTLTRFLKCQHDQPLYSAFCRLLSLKSKYIHNQGPWQHVISALLAGQCPTAPCGSFKSALPTHSVLGKGPTHCNTAPPFWPSSFFLLVKTHFFVSSRCQGSFALLSKNSPVVSVAHCFFKEYTFFNDFYSFST